MLRFLRLTALAIALGLWGCAQESPMGTEPEEEPEEDPEEDPVTPEVLHLRIGIAGDTLTLMLHDSTAVIATVVRADSTAIVPQPEITWSLSSLDEATAIAASRGPTSQFVRGVAIGRARLVALAPSLNLADTLVVRVWSPVASLRFELERDTVTWNGYIGFIAEARDSSGALLPDRFTSMSASSDSIAVVWRGGGFGNRLGTGTITASAPPLEAEAQITVLPLRVNAVENGEWNTCMRRDDGRLVCGGANAYLQLGRITPWQCSGLFGQYCVYGSSTLAEEIPELSAVTMFKVGGGYVCALRGAGEAVCWGGGAFGQLGTEATTQYCGNPLAGFPVSACTGVPVAVATPLRFRAISAGWSMACALTFDDRAWCWGSLYSLSRLGNGSTEGSRTPVAVSGDHAFQSITAGETTACAVDYEHAAWCWGWGGQGSLGAGPGIATALVPTRVVGDISFATVQNGYWGTCGLSTGGQAFCWGGEYGGFFGGTPLPEGCDDGATPNSCLSVPIAVAGDLRFTELAVGFDACGRTAAGEVWCWKSSAPQKVSGVPPLTQISVGRFAGCGIAADQNAYCWSNETREGRLETAPR